MPNIRPCDFRRFVGETMTASLPFFEDRVFFDGESSDKNEELLREVLGVLGLEPKNQVR